MAAMGMGAMSVQGRANGGRDDMREVEIWSVQLGLPDHVQIEIVEAITQRNRDGPKPRKFKYFTPAMREEAAARKLRAERMAKEPGLPSLTGAITNGRNQNHRNGAAAYSEVRAEARRALANGSLDSIVAGEFAPGASKRR